MNQICSKCLKASFSLKRFAKFHEAVIVLLNDNSTEFDSISSFSSPFSEKSVTMCNHWSIIILQYINPIDKILIFSDKLKVVSFNLRVHTILAWCNIQFAVLPVKEQDGMTQVSQTSVLSSNSTSYHQNFHHLS